MLTKRKESELLEKIKKNNDNLEGLISRVSIEEAFFVLQYFRCVGKNTGEGIPDVVASTVVEKLKEAETWFIIRSSTSAIPFIKDGRAYLFTSKEAGSKVLAQLFGNGYNLELGLLTYADEDVFLMLARYGVESVSFNKGEYGIVLDLRNFINIKKVNENYVMGAKLNKAAAAFLFASEAGNEKDVQERTTNFSRCMENSDLLYVSNDGGYTPKTSIGTDEKGKKVEFVSVFSDTKELRDAFPSLQDKAFTYSAQMFFENVKGENYVLNPVGVNILLGEQIVWDCLHGKEERERIKMEVKVVHPERTDVDALTEELYSDFEIRQEFLYCLKHDSFELPAGIEPVTVETYTADVLQRICVGHPLDAYILLSRMKKHPENIDNLVSFPEI